MQPRHLTGKPGGCLLSAVYLTVWEQIGVLRPMSSHPTESESAINVVLGREVEGWPHESLNCFVTSALAKPEDSWIGVSGKGKKGMEDTAPATHGAISRF